MLYKTSNAAWKNPNQYTFSVLRLLKKMSLEIVFYIKQILTTGR